MPLCDESAQTDCAYLETRGLGGWRRRMGQTRSRFLSIESLRFAFESQGAERGQKMDMKLRVFAVIVTMIVGGLYRRVRQ